MIWKGDKSQQAEAGRSDFAELFEGKLTEPKDGDIIKGKIIQVSNDYVMIDIGYKSEGLVPIREFLDESGKPTVKVGDEIKVLIERREDDKGYIVLSKAKADQLKIWDVIIESHDTGRPVDGTITQRVKGGFYVDIAGVTCFLPGSQVDLKPVRNQDKLVGQTYQFKVLKYNRRKSNVIVSRRALLESAREELKKITLEQVEEGIVLNGIVKNITDYGAFIDLGGIDGLVHLTDLSWGKAAHPSQVVKVGDAVSVKVLKFNKEDGKISLGLKQTKQDPWQGAAERYPQGMRLAGKVVNITEYGAFIELEPGFEGLVHISEMSWSKLKHPSQKVKPGEVVQVVVLDIDASAKRVSLGMKQIEANPWDEVGKKYPKGTRIKGVVRNITDFGVFIGVEEGIDGLVHVSDLSWKKIKHPSEIVKKGQEMEAVVVNIDALARRFSLSVKALEKNPWDGVSERYKPGMTVEGKVTSVAEFGAFVELEIGLEGLVHISELSRAKMKGSGLAPGDVVEVEILNVDPEDNKIGLSIRSVRSGGQPEGQGA